MWLSLNSSTTEYFLGILSFSFTGIAFKPTINRLSGFFGSRWRLGLMQILISKTQPLRQMLGVTSTLSVRNPESSGNMLSRGEDGVFR